MEKEIAMSQNMRPMWTHADTPAEYDNFFSSELPSGTVDESRVANFFNRYLPRKQKVLVDLGIGSGRELVWIDKLEGLSRIVGIDYSRPMLEFCRKNTVSCRHEVVLEQDDLLGPKILPGLVGAIAEPVVYVSLINSMGNFSSRERIRVLRKMKPLLRSRDRVILCLYKRPTLEMGTRLLKPFPESALPKNKIDCVYLNFAVEYALIPYVWNSIIERGGFPTFWYDKKSNDVVIRDDNEKVVISHRFDRKEIKDLARAIGLAIDRLITGKFMYIAILKK